MTERQFRAFLNHVVKALVETLPEEELVKCWGAQFPFFTYMDEVPLDEPAATWYRRWRDGEPIA